MFNPALSQYPKEAALIGMLVAGYPELDICLCHVCGLVLGDKFAVLDALHKINSEQTRIEMANSLAQNSMARHGLGTKFGEAIGAISFCRKVRNQYAHAQWANINDRLSFLRAENVKWRAGPGPLDWKSTSLPLLTAQESYFEYTRKCLMWLEAKFAYPKEDLKWPAHIARPPLQEPDALNSDPPPKQARKKPHQTLDQ